VSSSGGAPYFRAKGGVINPNAQVWTVSLNGGCFKIVSKADGRYVNEKGNFGTNPFYVDWNTYNIFSDSVYCGIQITQSAATQEKGAFFWNLNTSNAVVYSTNATIDEAKDLTFEFIPVTITALHSVSNQTCSVWTGKNALSIRCDMDSKVSIYNQMGRVIKQFQMTSCRCIFRENTKYC
jgi:hypothetical protein